MSVTIRLARIGRKNLPAFRVVVSNTKDKRNGKFLEILGHFNPSDHKDVFEYDKERFTYWKKNGALVTDSVQELIDGKYEYKTYKKVLEEAKEAKAEPKKEAVEAPAKTEEKVETAEAVE